VHVVKTSDRRWDEPLAPIPVTEVAAQMQALEAEAETDELAPLRASVLARTRRIGP
jgi:hypothetical protein